VEIMTPDNPQENRQEDSRYDPQDNPGTQTTIPTTEEGDTPLDERYRMTGQESGTDVRAGAEPEAPGGAVKIVGAPNQGTESR
jgi:photosystem I subunit 4